MILYLNLKDRFGKSPEIEYGEGGPCVILRVIMPFRSGAFGDFVTSL